MRRQLAAFRRRFDRGYRFGRRVVPVARSSASGKRIWGIEVVNLAKHGTGLLLRDRESFLPSQEHPWFSDATVSQTLNVTLVRPDHLRWPDMGVDLSVESIEHPERYPLISKGYP